MNILIVDDQRIVLDSIAMLLRQGIAGSNVTTALSGVQAIEMIEHSKPDVVLLDVNMPGMNGLKVAEYLNKKHPTVKIIVLTNVNGVAMVLALAKIVNGFLYKATGIEELTQCINVVMRGDTYFCGEVQQTIFSRMNSLDKLPAINLDERELLVIKKLSEGKTTKEIAVDLDVKETTVNSYREGLLKKTKTKNTTELVAFAFLNGII